MDAIYDNFPAACLSLDTAGNVLGVNAEMVSLFGFKNKAEAAARFYSLLPPCQPCGTPSAEFMRQKIELALQSGGTTRFELQSTRPDGFPAYFSFSLKSQPSHNLMACAAEITPYVEKSQQTTEDLQEADARAQILIKACPMAVSLFDAHLREISCNQAALDIYGTDNSYDFTESAESFLAPVQPDGRNNQEVMEDILRDIYDAGRHHAQLMLQKFDGTRLPLEITYVRLDYGNEFLIASYARDLTEEYAVKEREKEALRRQREADERTILMLDYTPLSCFLLQENPEKEGTDRYSVIDCNKAALSLFGFADKAEAMARYWELFPSYTADGKPNLEFTLAQMHSVIESGFIHLEEYINQNLKGELIPCEVTAFRITLRGANVMIIYLNDLRPIKAMVEEMKRIDIAEEESRAKTRFLARMSHEIRTPMNAVLGITEIQLQQNNLPPAIEEAFMRIHSSSRLLLTIINDILDLSKVEAGKMEIVPQRYQLASLIVDTVQLNLMHLGSKPVEFKLELGENLPANLIGDELRIKQILNNLLSNAFKYTAEGKVLLSFSAETTPKEVALVFEVQDTGQGMTQEQIDKLFNLEYTRFNIQSNHAIEGSGLGMSIAHQLVMMMGGDIEVFSGVGQGSTFRVRIPQGQGSDKTLDHVTAKSLENFEITSKALGRMTREVPEPMPYGRVLIVDDVDTNLYVAQGMLEPYALKIDLAESGAAAIQKVKDGEVYDIIFMDHMMPVMDGMEATKILRKMGYIHPIVALTANTLTGQAEIFMNNGFSGFISKPIDVDQMHALLVRFIKDKEEEVS